MGNEDKIGCTARVRSIHDEIRGQSTSTAGRPTRDRPGVQTTPAPRGGGTAAISRAELLVRKSIALEGFSQMLVRRTH